MVYHSRTGAAFDFFPGLQELRSYTMENELYFPKQKAKEGVLKYLLREILQQRRAISYGARIRRLR